MECMLCDYCTAVDLGETSEHGLLMVCAFTGRVFRRREGEEEAYPCSGMDLKESFNPVTA